MAVWPSNCACCRPCSAVSATSPEVSSQPRFAKECDACCQPCAVTQMDQAAQQNAAPVEESAAAAESLQQQAQQLVQAVAVLRLGHGPVRTLSFEPEFSGPRGHQPSLPGAPLNGPVRSGVTQPP